MTVRMRHTRAHTKNRRSHHHIALPRLSTCAQCSAAHIRHRACQNCGQYRGRVVIDVASRAIKQEKKAKRRAERTAQEKRESAEETKEAAQTEKTDTSEPTADAKPLSAEELSKRS